MPTIPNSGQAGFRGRGSPDGSRPTFAENKYGEGRRGAAAKPTFAVEPSRRLPRFISNPFNNVGRFITGVTKDSAGVALGFCTVQLFQTVDDLYLGEVKSDVSGNYSFGAAGGPYYIVAYKVGAPDVGGTTVNTLTGV